MSRWIMPPAAGLIEPVLAPQFTVDGIGAIELLNDHEIRVSMFERQMAIEAGAADPQLVLNVKLRGQIANLPQIMGNLWPCLYPALAPAGVQNGVVRLVPK